jgi:predicted phage terminase large subunit-like protein
MTRDQRIAWMAEPEVGPELFALYYLHIAPFPHQREWFDLLDQPRLLILSPRDHGKSDIFSDAVLTYQICMGSIGGCELAAKDPRVLHVAESKDRAEAYVGVIKGNLESNERIRNDFGELRDQGARWRDDQLYCRRSRRHRDPTLEAIGIGGAITGAHPTDIQLEDVQTTENTKTAGAREHHANWLTRTVLNMAEADTRVRMTGTRKHPQDLYGAVAENPIWTTNTNHRAIMQWPDAYEYRYDEKHRVCGVDVQGDSEVMWPEVWPIEALLIRLAEIGQVAFALEFQNDADVIRGKLLDPAELQFYDPSRIPVEMELYQGWDLAIKQSESADYTVGATVGLSARGKAYLLRYHRAKLTFPQQIAAIRREAAVAEQKWRSPVIQISIEDVAYQAAMGQQLWQATSLPVRMVTPGGLNKQTRIVGMAPHYESGRLQVRDDMSEFIREYATFPEGEHDDILDAVWYACRPILQRADARPGIAVLAA